MNYIYHDGGRKNAGYKGDTGDCVCRAICITTGLPYKQVYDTLAKGNFEQRRSKHCKGRAKTAGNGINTGRKWFKDYMISLGFVWYPTMGIGTGCTVHLHEGELPMGRLIVSVSKHLTAVIDGDIYDTYDPRRHTMIIDAEGGVTHSRRCVYGYYKLKQ